MDLFVFSVAPPDRITQKSAMRKWSNSRGEGTLFSIDLLDEEGSEIKGTFFKAEAERWYDELQEGQVYRISGGKIKVRRVRLPLFCVKINAVNTHRASFASYLEKNQRATLCLSSRHEHIWLVLFFVESLCMVHERTGLSCFNQR